MLLRYAFEWVCFIYIRMGLFYIHIHIHMDLHVRMNIRTYVLVCMYVCMCMCVCMYVCSYVRMYACMYACMYVCRYVCNIYSTHPPSLTLELASAAAARSRLIESYSLRTPALSLERVSRSATCCTRSCSSRSRNVCTSFVAASCLRRKSPSCALHDLSCPIHALI